MNKIQNKHGPDWDVGFLIPGRPRDGTERKPRDGTERKPRDGTERKPRDGTERKPRDGTERKPRDGTNRRPRDIIILQKGSRVIRLNASRTWQSHDVRNNCRSYSRWRKARWGKPAFWAGVIEVCPEKPESKNAKQ